MVFRGYTDRRGPGYNLYVQGTEVRTLNGSSPHLVVSVFLYTNMFNTLHGHPLIVFVK